MLAVTDIMMTGFRRGQADQEGCDGYVSSGW
jgi:hypothetical protein